MSDFFSVFNIPSGDALQHIIEAVLTLAVVIALVVIIRRAFSRLEKRALSRGEPTNILRVVANALTVFVVIIGGMAVFARVPTLKSIFSALLASSGVVALVLSLAAQDAIGNFIGGLMISISKPFKVGDTIRFIDTETIGIVTKITLRHTIIRTAEDKYVIVPNGTINSSVVENISYGGDIKVYMEIGVTYESDVPRAMELFAQSIRCQPNFRDPRSEEEKKNGVPDVTVNIRELGSSEIVLRACALVRDWDSTFTFKTAVYLTMMQKIKNENVDFAYPHVVVVKE